MVAAVRDLLARAEIAGADTLATPQPAAPTR
jgi:hypothetical protein